MKKITSIILLLVTTLAFSQTGETELYAQYKKAATELDSVFNKLQNKLGSIDKKVLIDSQQAWVKFRDLNCKLKSQIDSEGGVIANKMNIDCLTQSTIERIKELKDLLEGF